MRTKRQLALTLLLACGALLVSPSCGLFDRAKKKNGSSAASDAETQKSPLGLTVGLTTLSSCLETESYLKTQLSLSSKRSIDNTIKYLRDYGNGNGSITYAKAGATSSKTMSTPDAPTSSPSDFTTTNNQVAGVDEPDFVKNDATHIYQLAYGQLRILQSWPATDLKLLSSIAITGQPIALLTSADNRIIVIARPTYEELNESYQKPLIYANQTMYGADARMPDMAGSGVSAANDFTKIVVVNTSDKAAPAIETSYIMKGSYLEARKVNETVRLVLSDYLPVPSTINTVVPADKVDLGVAEQIAYLEELKATNDAIIDKLTLSEMLSIPAFEKIEEDKRTPAMDLGDCGGIHVPSVSSELGLTRIISLDIVNHTLAGEHLLAYVSSIYANEKSLYLVTPYYWWDATAQDGDYTILHKFATAPGEKPAYKGSGMVAGTILNQFAMDEDEDKLRIATTIHNYTVSTEQEVASTSSSDTTNRIFVLAEEDGKLTTIGSTGEMASDERIYSVRFMGKRGFMVTYRNTDPLFALDLSDPTKPTVSGELKLPGFSNYMHPVDETHILALGHDADSDGSVKQGLKLALFDVSRLDQPTLIQSYIIKDNLHTEAFFDHKAFTYFPSKKLLALPLNGYLSMDWSNDDAWWSNYTSVLKLFYIDSVGGIQDAGSVDMSDIHTISKQPWYLWQQFAEVRRSIFADEYVYALADAGVRVRKIVAPTTELTTVRYECDEACLAKEYGGDPSYDLREE